MVDQTVTVKDFILKTPIVGATVTMGGVSVTTDLNGVAVFPSGAAPPTGGSYTVSVTADSYFPRTVTFTGDTVEVDLVWFYSLPIAVGLLALGALIAAGAKLAGWW